MGQYQARHLLLVPSVLSLARVPLAVGFVFALHHPYIELAILALAGLTDVLDGWYARRHGQVTATGAVVDPITDKVFVATVVGALLASDRLSPLALLFLATREIGELPLVLWWAFSHERRQARAEQPMANYLGKLATVLQFATVACALFQAEITHQLLIAAAIAGAIAAIAYWRRELERIRKK